MTIELTEGERASLIRWIKRRAVNDKQRLRARIVLMMADGCSTQSIMQTLKVSNPTLNLWRRRYLESGVEGLKKGNTRPSRVPPLPTEQVQEVLTLTLSGKPVAAEHWSCRTMAQQVGISRMAVHGIWRKHRLKLHLPTGRLSQRRRIEVGNHGLPGTPQCRPETLPVDRQTRCDFN